MCAHACAPMVTCMYACWRHLMSLHGGERQLEVSGEREMSGGTGEMSGD